MGFGSQTDCALRTYGKVSDDWMGTACFDTPGVAIFLPEAESFLTEQIAQPRYLMKPLLR